MILEADLPSGDYDNVLIERHVREKGRLHRENKETSFELSELLRHTLSKVNVLEMQGLDFIEKKIDQLSF